MKKRLLGLCEPACALGGSVMLVLLLAGCGAAETAPETPRFVALDQAGLVVELDSGRAHYCVHDRQTGLLWQAEHDEQGMYARDDTFSWYSSDPERHMSAPGLMDGGACDLARCDTEALVAAVNARGLCGYHDWRLPSRDEALSLLDRTRVATGMTLDPGYFPHAVAGEYWTASTFRYHPPGAWTVDTRYALDRVDVKTAAKAVRLVRGPEFRP